MKDKKLLFDRKCHVLYSQMCIRDSRQRLAAERASTVAQADQRVDGQIKRTVHSYPSFTSS